MPWLPAPWARGLLGAAALGGRNPEPLVVMHDVALFILLAPFVQKQKAPGSATVSMLR